MQLHPLYLLNPLHSLHLWGQCNQNGIVKLPFYGLHGLTPVAGAGAGYHDRYMGHQHIHVNSLLETCYDIFMRMRGDSGGVRGLGNHKAAFNCSCHGKRSHKDLLNLSLTFTLISFWRISYLDVNSNWNIFYMNCSRIVGTFYR